MGQPQTQSEQRIVIVGVGLIGGSVAAACRVRFPDAEIIGIGRSSARLQQAKDARLITHYATEYTPELFTGRCLVVVCLPVDMIAAAVCEIAGLSSADVVLTDAGSVKGVICDDVSADPCAADRFVGAHPIAGGENGGFEYAAADLFDGRICVVTAEQDGCPATANVRRVSDFWQALGCRIQTMSAADHDRILALTSHLPHVMAAVTTSAVGPDHLAMCGSGFRDATRIAAGSAALWKAILTGNREHVVSAIGVAERQLAEFRTVLEAGDDGRLQDLLAQAAECRAQLD